MCCFAFLICAFSNAFKRTRVNFKWCLGGSPLIGLVFCNPCFVVVEMLVIVLVERGTFGTGCMIAVGFGSGVCSAGVLVFCS